MTIKDKFQQIFKCSTKSSEDLTREMRHDIQDVRFSADDFEKKYRKRRDQSIKKIPSLSEVEKEKEIELCKIFNTINLEVLRLAPLIKTKYEIANKYLKEYQDALRKSIKKD